MKTILDKIFAIFASVLVAMMPVLLGMCLTYTWITESTFAFGGFVAMTALYLINFIHFIWFK